jgi:hypothetical protein
MSKLARTIMTMVAGTLFATALQAAPLPGFSLAAQTEHFNFYSRDNQKVDAQKVERYLGQVQQLLGHKVSSKADYYRYGTAQEVAAGTGTYAVGVTLPGQIHSTEAFHAHEIVHLVAREMGNPGVFFQEGLAVALGNEAKWNGKDVSKLARPYAKVAIAKLVAGFTAMDADAAYPVAGSFVSSLIKAHGVEKVAEFFRSCRSEKELQGAFARTFGQSLDEAGAAWASSL